MSASIEISVSATDGLYRWVVLDPGGAAFITSPEGFTDLASARASVSTIVPLFTFVNGGTAPVIREFA